MTASEFLAWMNAVEKLKLEKPLTPEEKRLIATHGNPISDDVSENEDDPYGGFDGVLIFNPTRSR